MDPHSTSPSVPVNASGIDSRQKLLSFWRGLVVSCLLLFAAFLPQSSKAQILMSTGSSTTCSSLFYDSGGPSGTYSVSENYTRTIYPATAGGKVVCTFSAFATESGWDYLYIYNGNSTSAPLLGTYTGSTMPPTFTSTAADGSLTFRFTSDASVVAAGWTANLSCYLPLPCSGTVTAGTAVASSTTPCPGAPVTFSLSGSTGGVGMTYQWDTSGTGTAGTFVSVPGATTFSWAFVPPTGRTLYYRCTATCSVSSSSGISTTVSVTVPTISAPPYSETFEGVSAGNNIPCATASPSFSTGSVYYYNYDYWKLINDATATYAASNHTPSGSNYLVAGYYIGSYSGAGADYWFTPGLLLQAGKTYRFSYWHIMSSYAASSYSGTTDHGMYYANAPSKTATVLTAIKPDIIGTSNSTYVQNVGDFSVPSSGVYYMAIKANNRSFGGYYCGASFDDLNLIELPACNTATVSTFGRGGKTNASPNVICSTPGTTALSVTGTPPFSGLTFAWDSAYGSPTAFYPAAAPGSGTPSYNQPISTGGSFYFRCKVTCTATGLTTYSDTVRVNTTPITPPYVEDFESGTPGVNMPCASYTYSWSSGSYWYLQGGPYASYTPGIVNHTTGGSKYLHAGYALGTVSSGGDEYWFTPGLALTVAKAYSVSFWFSNSAYSSSYSSIPTVLGVAAGTAQTKAAMTIVGGADTIIYNNGVLTPTYNKLTRGFIAPATGTYYVGIKVNNSGYSYYGMAIDDIGINLLPPCSAKPSAGKAVASPSLICTTGTSTLSVLGMSLASDLSFSWDSSVVSSTGPWSAVVGGVGANTPSYTTSTLSVGPVYYRCRVICGAISAPNTDTSIAAVVNVGAIALPYVEDFESGVAGVNMPCASQAGTWNATSLLYWSLKSGAYSTSYPGVDNHTPGGTKYLYSGYYNGPYYGSGDQYYWFTPALKMTSGKGYQVGFWYNGAGYSTGTNGLKIGIYAGTAQTAAGMTIRAGGVDSVVDATSGTYRKFVRSFIAPTTGNYYVGLKTVHLGYNYPGIPIDDININQLPDCSSKPTAGTPDATPSLICSTGTTVLRLTGTSVASGITYKWLESTTSATAGFTACTTGTGFAGGDYTTASLSAQKWYRCVVTCSLTGQFDTSVAVLVNVGAITPPYKEDFEKVIPGTNAPCASYSSTWSAASATTYWTTKGFNYTAYGLVHTNHTPGGSNYLWAGYYFGYSPAAGAMWFTPAIKLTKDSTYEFSYWYMGPGYYYYNSGVEMGMFYGTAQTEAAMTTAIRPLFIDKTSSYRQLIGRFKSIGTGNYYMGIKIRHTYTTYSYYGTSIDDIGLDQLAPCAGMPTAGTVFATPDELCSAGTVALDMNYTGVTKASGLTYRWESSVAPTSGYTDLSGPMSAPNYNVALTATRWFRCVVKCNNTGDSVYSSAIKVDVGIVTPPYIQTFEGVSQGVNAPCASTTNTFSPSSWSYWGTYRVPISTSYPAIYNHTAGGTAYLMAGYALGSYSSGKDEYWFTPQIQLTGGKLYQFSFWYSGSGYSGGKTNFAAAYGTTNTAAGMTTVIGTPLTGVNEYTYKRYAGYLTPSASGPYYIGIRVNSTVYSYPGVAIDDIGLQEVPPCSSPVVAGTINSNPSHVCATGGTAVLDLTGSTLATGLTYDWYAAPAAAGPYTSTGGTTLPYTTDPLIGNTWFRVVVTCTASGLRDTSAAFMMGVGGYDLPYTEDFESTAPNQKPTCSDATAWGTYFYDAWNVYGSTYTGSYSNHTPGGKNYLIGGYFMGYSTYSPTYTTVTDENYWFTPGLNMKGGYKYRLSFWYLGAYPGYRNRMGVFYGSAQSPASMTNTIIPFKIVNNTTYTQVDTAFTVARSGTYYLGFKKATGAPSEYDLYGVAFDDINLNYAPCDGTPFAGTIVSSVPSGTAKCAGTRMTLTDIGATINLVPGIKYHWQRRGLGGASPTTWRGVAGARDTILSADTLIGYEYRLAVICSNTNDTVYTVPFQLPAQAPHPAVSIAPTTTPITYCLGDTVRFTATNFSGATYDWMVDSVVAPGWKFSDFGATDPGTVMVKVTSPLSVCPAWSNKVKMIANDPGYTVSITKPADSIICAGSSVLLTAVSSKPGVTYQWRKNNVPMGITTSTLLVTTGGYYRVMTSDGVSSCPAASRNVQIIVKPNPPAVITVPGGTTTACENEGVQLNANTGGYSYEWTRGGSTIVGWTDSSQIIKNSGTYAVKVRTHDGCATTSSSVTVNILPSPVPVITKTVTGTTIVLSTGFYPSWQWYRNGVLIPGATAQTFNPLYKGVYKVRVVGTNNCTGESNPIELMEDFLGISNAGAVNDQIKVYPSPTASKVYIESPIEVRVKVKDMSGRTVYEDQVTKEVDLSKYADGVYLFMISDKSGNELIKQQRVSKISNK